MLSAWRSSATFAPAALRAPRVGAVSQSVTAIGPVSRVTAPIFRLTYKVEGKTISEALPSPAAVQKAEREAEEFRKFQQLRREFLGTNAEICRLRPLEEQAETELKKKRPKRFGKRSRAK